MKILLFFFGLIVFAFVLAVCILPFVNLASMLSLRRKVKQQENTIARLSAELRGLKSGEKSPKAEAVQPAAPDDTLGKAPEPAFPDSPSFSAQPSPFSGTPVGTPAVSPEPVVTGATRSERNPAPSPVQKSPEPKRKAPAFSHAAPTPSAAPALSSSENFIGKIILSVTAAFLIFIGLIFLAVDSEISNSIRIFAMFALAGSYLAAGLVLGRKKHNNLTLALTGCGCGSLFLAILLTHIWFGYLHDIVAFSLLLLWTAFALFLSYKTDSILLNIIAHIGMVTSICFGFSQNLDDSHLLLLLIYQLASSAILILGNFFCYKRTYHIGLLVSLALTSVAGGFLWHVFTPRMEQDALLFPSALPIPVIAAAFYLQFLAATYLSYLLSVSAARMKRHALLLQILNKTLWVASAGINFCLTTYNLFIPILSETHSYTQTPLFSLPRVQSFLAVVLFTLLIYLVHVFLTMLCRKKLEFPASLETVSLTVLTIGMTVLLFAFYGFANFCINSGHCICNIPFQNSVRLAFVPFSFLPLAVFLLFLRHKTGQFTHFITALVLFVFDAFYMLVDGYRAFLVSYSAGAVLVFSYVILCLAAFWVDFAVSSPDFRKRALIPLRIGSLLFFEVSLIVIFFFYPVSGWGSTRILRRYILPILLLSVASLLYFFRYDRSAEPDTETKKAPFYSTMRVILFINEGILLSVSAVSLALKPTTQTELVLLWILFPLSLLLAFCRIREVLSRPGDAFLSVFSGIKLTVLILSFIKGSTTLMESGYLASIFCMLTALIAVLFGFFIRSKGIRLYGLILTIGCILKLVTFDASGASTLTRVLAFIAGGLICFVISAAYTYAERRLLHRPAKNPSSGDEAPPSCLSS